MSLDEIQTTLIEVLREVQTLSGRSWTALQPTARPIGDLECFDSLLAVEATVMVEEKLGCRELEVESLFISEDGKRALTVREISERISELLSAQGDET